jgi:D-lactate dehydrogenase (cytochrome)
MSHFIVEGFDAGDVASRARQLRRLMAPFGREIVNSIPAFVRTMPFAPLFNILGPGGERWVPIHGVFTHDAALGFDRALKSLLEQQRAKMDQHGVWIGTMFSTFGSTGFLYEIALYWPDARTAYHLSTLDPAHIAALPDFPANPEARAYVEDLKRALIETMQTHGASHFQIGRAYPYQQRLAPPARALLGTIKQQLDPHNLMNPGALGF